jgi:hypothetical protein
MWLVKHAPARVQLLVHSQRLVENAKVEVKSFKRPAFCEFKRHARFVEVVAKRLVSHARPATGKV